MLNPISVNAALDRLIELNGQMVNLVGALSLDFEGTCIYHIPKSECHSDEVGTYQSSIWVNFDLAAMKQNEQWLQQYDDRHVRVEGRLAAPEKGFDGCGHFSLWPAKITVTKIVNSK
ncbi:MAG: hypothetical protein RLN82_05485, partial [Pseudomonadales bacterium]